MRVVAWLTTILIGSAMLGIGCWFEVVLLLVTLIWTPSFLSERRSR
jgi:hypothetical protein